MTSLQFCGRRGSSGAECQLYSNLMHDDARVYPPRIREVEAKRTTDFAADLNAAQLKAATHADGPLLIIAGAGTGKTRTLVYRVAHLLEKGVRPERILLLTFTRRSAQEMLGRAERLVGSASRAVHGGTFSRNGAPPAPPFRPGRRSPRGLHDHGSVRRGRSHAALARKAGVLGEKEALPQESHAASGSTRGT